MKKRILILLTALLLIFALVACSGAATSNETTAADTSEATQAPASAETEIENPTSTEAAETKVVVDMAGREVTIPAHPQRIAATAPNEVMTMLVFNQIDKLVAVAESDYSDFAQHYDTFPTFEYQPFGETINEEELLSANVDVVMLRATSADDERLITIEELGIPCLIVNCNTIDSLKDMMRVFGEVLDDTATADKFNAYFDSNIEIAKKLGEELASENPPSVLGIWPVEAGQYRVPATSLQVPLFLDMLGVTNAWDKDETVVINAEELLSLNPDIIISLHWASFNEILDSDDAFKAIPAVQNGHFYTNPNGFALFTSASLENALEPLMLANIIYGEDATGISSKDAIHDFYKEFFRIELSDEQLNNALEAKGISPVA